MPELFRSKRWNQTLKGSGRWAVHHPVSCRSKQYLPGGLWKQRTRHISSALWSGWHALTSYAPWAPLGCNRKPVYTWRRLTNAATAWKKTWKRSEVRVDAFSVLRRDELRSALHQKSEESHRDCMHLASAAWVVAFSGPFDGAKARQWTQIKQTTNSVFKDGQMPVSL